MLSNVREGTANGPRYRQFLRGTVRSASLRFGALRGLWLVFCLGFHFGDFFAREGFQFVADYVGGKAGAKEAAVNGTHFVFGDFAAKSPEFAINPLADNGGFVGFFCRFGKGGFNVAVWDTPVAQFTGDTEFALAADFGALAGELFGEAFVVEQVGFFEKFDDQLDEFIVVRAAAEMLLHLMDGVSAAHEGADGGVVKLGLGFDLAGFGEHGGSIEVMKERSKGRNR